LRHQGVAVQRPALAPDQVRGVAGGLVNELLLDVARGDLNARVADGQSDGRDQQVHRQDHPSANGKTHVRL